jgi:hypothetical protein
MVLAVTGNHPALGDSPIGAPKLLVTLDAYPELCAEAEEIALRLYQKNGDFCRFPDQDPGSEIKPIEWKSVDVERARDVLRENLLHFGWDTRGSLATFAKTYPTGTPLTRIEADFWAKTGKAMLDALVTPPGSLSEAELDLNDDQTVEHVYRISTLQPGDKNVPPSSWNVLPCGGGEKTKPDTFFSLLFSKEQRAELDMLGRPTTTENKTLMTYRGRVYLADVAASSVFLALIEHNSTSPAFALRKCNFMIDPMANP